MKRLALENERAVVLQMAFRAQNVFGTFEERASPGACFSKVPNLFGRISGDLILFVSSKRRRFEARYLSLYFILQIFLFLFPLQHMKRPALQNKQAGVLRIALRARKAFGTFEKRAPEWAYYLNFFIWFLVSRSLIIRRKQRVISLSFITTRLLYAYRPKRTLVTTYGSTWNKSPCVNTTRLITGGRRLPFGFYKLL